VVSALRGDGLGDRKRGFQPVHLPVARNQVRLWQVSLWHLFPVFAASYIMKRSLLRLHAQA
jgi:hypothetical protein